MPRSNLDSKKVLVVSIALILVAAIGLILYYNYKADEMNKEMNMKLLILDKNLESLKDQVSSLNDNLTSEIGIIDTNLRNFKKQNENEISALNSLINQIEEQSNIKLGELKDELKTIQVKSKDFTAIINDVMQSVVSVGTSTVIGSGAVIDERGFIVTNFHVVNGAKIIRVLASDNKVYDAALIGYNDIIGGADCSRSYLV